MAKRYNNFKLILSLTIFCNGLFAQTGGRHVFQFLNTSPGARISALGGMPISWRSSDPSVAFLNPAVLNPDMGGSFQFSNLSYFADISFGHFSYSHHPDSSAYQFQLGTHYARYGDITRSDIYGNQLGSFKANETAIYFAASRTILERLMVGASLNYIFSTLDDRNSQALSLNTGLSYANPIKNFGISLLFKHIGFQLSPFNEINEKLPFEVQLAYSKKLKHLPLIYHFGIQHLEKWNIRYDDPDLADDGLLFGETPSQNKFDEGIDNFFRHMVFGVELNIGKKENFSLRLGYNHLRNRELKLSDYRSFAGISAGFGLKIYKFKFDYSYAAYHIAGGSSQITISTNIHSFLKKDL